MELSQHIAQEVDIDALLAGLAFDEDTVVLAGSQQACLHEAASRLRAQKQEERLNAKVFLEMIEADAYLAAKRHLERTGDKATVDVIRSMVTTQKKVVKAKARLVGAEVEEDYTKSLVESYRQRGFALQVVSDLVEGQLKQIGRTLIKDMAAKLTTEDTAKNLRKKYPKGRI
jgi:hypothetical protein